MNECEGGSSPTHKKIITEKIPLAKKREKERKGTLVMQIGVSQQGEGFKACSEWLTRKERGVLFTLRGVLKQGKGGKKPMHKRKKKSRCRFVSQKARKGPQDGKKKAHKRRDSLPFTLWNLETRKGLQDVQ